ncbi:MAG: 2-C-methyl-D-erythritol 2,4-cyclodiphosphate synthase [Deltaproteobacteria bacterium]|nr:2-C-methyl-D-erythritol 2,4-cyclodiphosphate synthase [Deltaproteobacteria bacterium]
MKVGIGYDCHRLQKGRRLVIGGVSIPHHKGSLGHSDGDVLIHAICDAILGAVSAEDIGTHFPDTDARYFGLDSERILTKCLEILKEKGFRLVNVDSVVILEEPKIGPYRKEIIRNLSRITGLREDDISVKAKTKEGFCFVGDKEGIEAYAVVLVEREPQNWMDLTGGV